MNHQHSMDCQDILGNLNAYIDSELDDEICDAFEAHVGSCPNCQIVVNTLKKTIELCRVNGQEIKLPPETRQRLYHKLNLDDDDE